MKTILADAVGAVVSPEGAYDTELLALLESYPHSKIVLTGADDEQMAKFGLDRCPYPVFTLRHDPEKSDPRYYEAMLAHYGLDASGVAYFEHAPAAVQSARSVGIDTYLYDGVKRDLAALKEFLDSNLREIA